MPLQLRILPNQCPKSEGNMPFLAMNVRKLLCQNLGLFMSIQWGKHTALIMKVRIWHNQWPRTTKIRASLLQPYHYLSLVILPR